MRKEALFTVLISIFFCTFAWGATVDLDPIVVTPSRVGEPAAEALSNVAVVSRQEIDRSGAASIPDLLERAAGVSVYSQNSPKNKMVDIRGQGDTAVRNVLVLVNGRRVNPVDISGPDWLQVPLESIERIEIIRGAASVTYGDNANAGVVNIITKDGRGEKPYAEVSGGFGSYGLRRYGAETGGQRGDLSYYFNAGYSDLDGYRVNSGVQTKDGQGRLGYAVNDHVRFDMEGAWHEDDYRLPGGISAAWMEANGRRSSDTPNDFADTTDRFIRISTELKPFVPDGSYGTLSLDYSRRERDTLGFLDYGGGFSSDTDRDIKTDVAGAKYVLTPQMLGRDLRLTGGVDFSSTGNSIVSSSGPDLMIRKKGTGVYLLSDYALTDRLSVNAGIRHERADYIFDQHNVPAYETRHPRVTASSGGIKYEYGPGSNVFASAAQTFRFLATDEWFSEWTGLDTSLEQQEGVEYQLGMVHSIRGLRLDATGFYIRNKDEIFVDPTLGWGLGANSNYGRTRRIGLELGASLDMRQSIGADSLKAWDIYASGSVQSPRFEDGVFDDKVIPFVPRRQLKAGTRIDFHNGLGLDVAGRYTGAQFPINDTLNERPKTKPVLVVDTRVRWAWKSSEIYAGINNLFDEHYYDYVAYGHWSGNTDYYPAAERNYVAGMKYRF